MAERIGVTINGKHTYDDWGMKWDTCEVSEPVAKTKYVEIPGRKTPLDATESLFGTITYENRTITLGFHKECTWQQWNLLLSTLNNFMAGRLVRVILDTEPDKYWMGRAKVSSTKPNWPLANFTITVEVEPFKYFEEEPSEEWLWDPFSFVNGVIRNYRDIAISGTTTVSVVGTECPAIPTVTASADMTLVVSGKTYSLEANVPLKLNDVLVYKTAVSFRFTGSGTATITFRGETL